jgi:6-phosphogluconolactonase (cycloisomerase 2 family)
MTGDAPIDIAFSRNSHFLYVLNANETSITGFALDSSGQLTPVEVMNALPGSANGLAAL